jgi:hypothetical protein
MFDNLSRNVCRFSPKSCNLLEGPLSLKDGDWEQSMRSVGRENPAGRRSQAAPHRPADPGAPGISLGAWPEMGATSPGVRQAAMSGLRRLFDTWVDEYAGIDTKVAGQYADVPGI